MALTLVSSAAIESGMIADHTEKTSINNQFKTLKGCDCSRWKAEAGSHTLIRQNASSECAFASGVLFPTTLILTL